MGAHYHAYERNYPYTVTGEFDHQESPYLWQEQQTEPTKMRMISTINGIAGSDTLLDNADGAHDFIDPDSYGITGFGLLRVTTDSLTYK